MKKQALVFALFAAFFAAASVYDGFPTLPGTKIDGPPVPGIPPQQKTTASEFNNVVTSIADLRQTIQGALPSEGGQPNWFGLFPNDAGGPVPGSGVLGLWTDGNVLRLNGVGDGGLTGFNSGDEAINVTAPPYDAKCDADYDPLGNVVTGTDDTAAIQAALNAVTAQAGTSRRGGADVFFPRLCLTTQPLTVSIPNTVLRGTGSFYNTTSAIPTSGILFNGGADGGSAINVTTTSTTIRNMGVVSKGIFDAIKVTGSGPMRLQNARLYQLLGSCAGCLPNGTGTVGLHAVGTQSGYTVQNSFISGFDTGLKFEATSQVLIEHNTMNNNGIAVSFGNTGGLANAGEVITANDIEGNTIGNVQIIYGSGVTVSHNYFEVDHLASVNSYALYLGDGGSGPTNNVEFESNYIACNSLGAGVNPILILGGENNVRVINNAFVATCGSLNLATVAGTTNSGLYFAQNTGPIGGITSQTGVIYDDAFSAMSTRPTDDTGRLFTCSASTVNAVVVQKDGGVTDRCWCLLMPDAGYQFCGQYPGGQESCANGSPTVCP